MSRKFLWILPVAGLLLGASSSSASEAILLSDAVEGFAAVAEQESAQKEKKEAGQKTGQKKKSKIGEGDPRDPNRRVLSRVLRRFKDSLEQQTPARLRDLIDRKKFYDFPRFEDGVTQFLSSVSEMRVFIRESSVEVKDKHAVMVVDAELRFTARSGNSSPVTRRQRITFNFYRTDYAWKITEIKPRSFFLP